ncbi:MAG: glycosyltransferase family 61 protein [Chloroflexi bacterium]|nr:glycosyltransferase family 61 protein [Chloroflexota bacterium]
MPGPPEMSGRGRGLRRRVGRVADRALVRLGVRTEHIEIRPKHSSTAAEYAGRFGARWQVVKPADQPVRVPAIQFGARSADFERLLVPVPDLGLLWLDRATIVGPMSQVVSKEGYLVSSTTFWHAWTKGIPDWGRRAQVQPLRGALLSIGSDYARGNYGHFLLDSVPRIALVEGAGVSWDDVDHVYCSIPSASAGRLLDQLGVPTDRRVLATPGVAIRPDTGIVTSYPGSRRNYPRWMVEFLRERLGVSAAAPSRRLYIPRTGHRQISNLDDLMPLLEQHGFEIFEPTNGGEDPRHAFAEAEVVVGGHGAGLADLVFSRPGTRVLELVPDSHAMPFYMTLSGSADLRYGYLLGTGQPSAEPKPKWDYRIDPDEFRAALEATLG